MKKGENFMKMSRRILALLLALCLTFGNVMPAMATGLEGEMPAVTEETPVVPEVKETEALTEEPTEAPVVETEAPVVETEAPVVETEAPTEAPTEPIVEETIAQIVDEPANEAALVATMTGEASNRISYSTTQQVWQANGITLTNDQGSSTSSVGDYTNPIRLYKSSTVKVEYAGTMEKIVFTCHGQTKYVFVDELTQFGTVTTDGYVVTLVLNEPCSSIEFVTTAQRRVAQIDVYGTADSGSGETCTHEWDEGVVTAPTCTTDGYTTYTCTLCGDTKTGDTVKAGHTNDENGVCTVCGDGTPLTIAEVLAMELTGDTTIKYYVTGVITEVYNTSYGNMYITDGNGNTLTIYGSYSADGSVRYDKLETKPVAGDTVKLYGILSVYNGNPQMKNGWIVEHTPAPCEHTNHGVDGLCSDCSVEVGHTFKDGACVCGAKETLTIDEAIKLGESRSSNSYTTNMYYVTGVITEVYNDQYGNMYITDDNGNTLTIYGTYSADGKTRYDALETKPVAGDTVKLYGVIGQYNGTAQMKNGRIIEHTPAGSTEPEVGTEENPVEVTFEMNMTYTEGTATVTIPANTTYYCSAYGIGGMLLSINDGEGTMMSGNPRMPVIFPVENTTDAEATFTLVIRTPLGAMNNPAALADGANVANIAAGSQGYFYTWTAPADGKLTVEISATTGWTYAINNLTTSTYGDTQWSDSDPVVNPATLDVTKGDELQIMVNTYDPADQWNAPAGAVTVTTSFAALGSVENPIDLTADLLYENDFSATVTIPAGETYNFVAYRVGGMLMSVNGGDKVLCSTMGMMAPYAWTITNDGNADAEYVIEVSYPVGSQMNPEELADGTNVLLIEAGNEQGHYYTWTAPARGTLTIDIGAETGWTYTINNLTTGIYGDQQWSDSEPVVNTAVIEVSEGDELEIIVNTYDPADMWNNPAGEIALNTTFEPAQGSSLKPDTMNVAEYEWENSENIVDIPEGIDGYFFTWNAYASGKLTIDVSNGKAGWAYLIQKQDVRGIGEWHYSYDVPAVNVETVSVNAGDVITVVINTCGETAEDITPAGAVYFYATFEQGVGTEENPLVPEWIWNDAGTEATATVTVPAGTSIFTAFDNDGMLLSINDGEPVAITGNWYEPQVMELTGAEEGETVYTLKLTHPVGSAENPAEMVMGENVASVPADSRSGYNYSWTAEERGQFTFNMTSESNWEYVLNVVRGYDEEWGYPINDPDYGYNMTASYGDPTTMTVDVEAGQTIKLMVATEDYTAGTITFTAAFAPAVGNASNPEMLQIMGDNQWFGNELAPGQSYSYFGYGLSGMMMYVWASNDDISVEIDGQVYTIKDQWLETLVSGGNPRMPVTITFTNNTEEPQAYEFIFQHPYGSNENPAEMVIGKNTIKLAADDMDGYTYAFAPNGHGYLTLTMNTTSNWIYTYQILKYDEQAQDYMPYKYGDIQYSSDKTALKTQTIPLEGNEVVLVNVGTENGKAGTITFTAAFANKMVDMLAGKTTTLTFTNPANGKTVSASNANWKIVGVFNEAGDPVDGILDVDGNLIAEKVAEYATITTAGKLSAKASDEWHCVVVEAALKSDETVTNQFVVYVYPAVTSIQVNQVKGEYWVDGYYDDNDEWVDGRWEEDWETVLAANVTEVTVVANSNDTIWLDALVGPDAAMQDLVWKSSNPKLVDVGTYGEYVCVYANGYNEKTDKYATGTATLTATAADGSGKKVTIKVKVVLDTKSVEVTAKNNQYMLASGKSMTLTANLNTWYNQAPTNKTVTWSMVMSDGTYEWIADPNGSDQKWIEDETHPEGGYIEQGTYVTNWIEVPSSVATLSKTGVLKAAAGLKQTYEIKITATVTNSDGSEVSDYTYVYVKPAQTGVEIYNVPAIYDVNFGGDVYPEAYVYYEVTEENGIVNIYDMGDPVWTVSNTKIAQMVELDEPHIEYVYDDEGNEYENCYWTQLVFTGVTGKVTLTATANDGSGVKKSVTINVVKAPSMIDLSTYEAKIAAGKALTIKATPCIETGWNEVTETPILDTAVTDKTVIWSFADPDAAAAIGAKISGGKLTTNAKLVTEPVTLEVVATAKLGIYDPYFDETNYASASCIVTIYPATTKVTLHRFGKTVTGTLNLDKDSYAVLHAEGSPADGYTWKTSNAKIATIEDNADGSITVRPTGKLGSVVITATAADGTNKSAKITLKIIEKIDKLEIAEVGVAATKSVNLNNFLTINPSNATMKKVNWSWASEYDAQYAAELKVTLNAAGTLSAAKLKSVDYPITLEVRAVAADGLGAQKYAYVTIYPATTKVTLTNATSNEVVTGTKTIDINDILTLTAQADPEAAQNAFKWTTSNAKIATIEVVDGVCTVVPTGKVGSAVIKATATDGTNKSAQVTVKVTKAVKEVSLPTNMLYSVGKGKTVTLSKSVVFNPTDASNKNLTWSMKLWNAETEAFDLDVPKTMATLNATSGALKCVNVSVITAVEVTFTSKDGFGASGSAVVALAPAAVKSIKILDQNAEVDLTRKTSTTSNGYMKLYPQATNDPDTEQCVSGYTCTVSNKNFEVVWDGKYAVVQPVEGAANPFGTVKVTFKATDGSNVSNYTTIKFEPAT